MKKDNLGVIRRRYTDMIYKQKLKVSKLRERLKAEEYLMNELEKEKKLLGGSKK